MANLRTSLSTLFMERCQNFYFDNNKASCKTGSCVVKSLVASSNLGKLVHTLKDLILIQFS